MQIPDDISTESCRVHFITTCVEKIQIKVGIKVNARKLYGADGYAVKELLKLAQMLYDAQKSVSQPVPDKYADDSGSFALSSKLHDLKSTRSKEARNTPPFCPSQEKCHTVGLRGVRNIYEAP